MHRYTSAQIGASLYLLLIPSCVLWFTFCTILPNQKKKSPCLQRHPRGSSLLTAGFCKCWSLQFLSIDHLKRSFFFFFFCDKAGEKSQLSVGSYKMSRLAILQFSTSRHVTFVSLSPSVQLPWWLVGLVCLRHLFSWTSPLLFGTPTACSLLWEGAWGVLTRWKGINKAVRGTYVADMRLGATMHVVSSQERISRGLLHTKHLELEELSSWFSQETERDRSEFVIKQQNFDRIGLSSQSRQYLRGGAPACCPTAACPILYS